MEDFFDLLSADKKMHVEDVAKFFLSIGSITNLKLQKLIYFAYATHLKNTGKKLFEEHIVASKLDEIEGLGPKRKKLLLKEFKSLKNVTAATMEELQQIGLPKNVAQNVFDKLHEN